MRFTHTPVELHPNITSADTPKGRFYTVPSGEAYPSITTILGDIEKPAVRDWRKSLGVDKAAKETKRAADRGTAVHSMIENYLNNHPDPTAGFDIQHAVEFRSVRLKLNKINNILCQEYPLYSSVLRTAGRVDCIGYYNGKLCVIDFKTSTGNKSAHMITDYFLQTTAYAVMFQEMYNIQIDHIVIIMSVEKGIPLVFHETVDQWISPLCDRINTYYTSKGLPCL